MKNRIAGKLESFANIAIIVVALTLTAVLVKKFIFTAAPAASRDTAVAGTKVDLPQIDWQANGRTLVMVLSTDCRYCHQSLPFYQRLSRAAQESGGFQMLAVLPQDAAVAEDYLRTNGVAVNRVVQAHPPSLGVGGTPTLLLVDQSGVIVETWSGQLVADQEKQVFDRLGARPAIAATR